MLLLVLRLLCSCLNCLREGVWTKNTPADVARWQTHSMDETVALRLPIPERGLGMSPFLHGFSGPAGSAAQ